MIVRTDAVVLRALDYSETSRIVTLLTRKHGIVSALARGARRPTSRFGSTLQPMACVEVVYYHKEGRSLQTLKEAAHLRRFDRLTGDLDRVTRGLRMVELTRALLSEGEAHPPVFLLLVQALTALDAAEARAENVLPWFQLRLAYLLGFAPDVRKEDVLDLGEDGGTLRLSTGVVGPPVDPGREGVRATRAALRAFAVFARADLDTALRMRLSAPLRAETEALADLWLRHHAETLPERVRRVAEQMSEGLREPAAD
ncbi:MAG TPA: DNA repair protein RecO [Rubricoccaceae bacterium]|nr:DNA repair protein RecO [Rubricoccaceae bacterium]